MVVFKDQHSPRSYDELGQFRPLNKESDLNPAWENQRKTYQQFVKTYDGAQGYRSVPAADRPGPFTDKDENRGIAATQYNNPLMTTGFTVGGLAIAYMVMKAIVH